MSQISFILPDGTIRNETLDYELPFRHICREFNLKIPYEFRFIYEQNSEQLIGKNNNLEFGKCYKVIDGRAILKTILRQDQMIRDFEQQISQLKEANQQLLTDNQQVKDENEKEKDENSKLKDQNLKIKDENLKLQEQVNQSEMNIKNSENEKNYKLLNKLISDLQQKCEDQKNQYFELKRKSEYKTQLQQSNNQQKELEQQKQYNQTEISNLKNQLQEYNLNLSIIQELKEKIKILELTLDDQLQKNFQLKSNEQINKFKLKLYQTKSQKDIKNLEMQILSKQQYYESELSHLSKQKEYLEEKLKNKQNCQKQEITLTMVQEIENGKSPLKI